MGYEVRQSGCRFELRAENKLAAFDAAIVLFPHGRLASNPNVIEHRFKTLRVEYQVNQRGILLDCNMLETKGECRSFFGRLGRGSQVDFVGEDEKRFSFVFDGTACRLDYFAAPVAMT